MAFTNLDALVFDSIDSANAALHIVNVGEGYVGAEDIETLTYTSVFVLSDGRFAIVYDDVIAKYFDNPQTIQIEVTAFDDTINP